MAPSMPKAAPFCACAEFLVVDTQIDPELYENLRGADEFESCGEDRKMAVFRLLPVSSEGADPVTSPATDLPLG